MSNFVLISPPEKIRFSQRYVHLRQGSALRSTGDTRLRAYSNAKESGWEALVGSNLRWERQNARKRGGRTPLRAPPHAAMSRLADLPVELRHAVIEAIQQPGLIRARNGPRVAGDTCSLLALACTSTYWRIEVMIFIEDSAIGGRGRGSGFVITMDAHAGPWHGRQDLPIHPSINPSINPEYLCQRVLRSLRWVGVSELNLKNFRDTGGEFLMHEVVLFLRGPLNARLRLVSLRLSDNGIKEGFRQLRKALKAGLAPNLAILDVSGNYHRRLGQRFLDTLISRSYVEVDDPPWGLLRRVDAGDERHHRVTWEFPLCWMRLGPVRDGEWCEFAEYYSSHDADPRYWLRRRLHPADPRPVRPADRVVLAQEHKDWREDWEDGVWDMRGCYFNEPL